MRKEPKLTQDRLRQVVSYDQETGIFVWRIARRGKVKAGNRAGKLKDGYRRICIDNVSYQASALAWFWVHGEWPARNLRHKDENRDNAAIANLSFGETDRASKDSMNAYSRKYRAENPDTRRAWQRKAYYGLTLAQYQQMLLDQKGVCACCGLPETATQRGKVMTLCVDHSHDDHTIRGLLCQHCNKMLGHAKDSVETLAKAIEYLQAHASKPKTNVIPMSGRKIANLKGA